MRPPRPSVRAASAAALVLLAWGAAGCAPVLPKMSFAEARLLAPVPEPELEDPEGEPLEEEHEEASRPPVAVPAPEAVASEAPAGPPIDATILRFASEARGRRGRHPARGGFPGEAVAAWRELAPELDRYLSLALPQTPLLELVRVRVTVEAEWDYDRRRWGLPPPDLAREIEGRASRLGRRIDTARALGFALFKPSAPPRLRWPIEHAGLSSHFGMRHHPVEGRRRMHYGIDLAASPGRVVSAAAAGWVVRAGWTGGHGLMVEVRHAGDITTRYSHLSAVLCAPGDAVDPGHPLGLVGRTGLATGPHLHFEVWEGGEPSDPLPWLGLGPGSAGK